MIKPQALLVSTVVLIGMSGLSAAEQSPASRGVPDIPEDAPPSFRKEATTVSERVLKSGPLGAVWGQADAAERLAGELDANSVPFLKREANDGSWRRLAEFTLAKMALRTDAGPAIREYLGQDEAWTANPWQTALAVAQLPPNVSRPILKRLQDSHAKTAYGEPVTGAVWPLLSFAGDQDTIPFLQQQREALRRNAGQLSAVDQAWYLATLDQSIASLDRIVTAAPPDRETQIAMTQQFWLERANTRGYLAVRSEYPQMVRSIKERGVRFPAEFLLAQLPAPGKQYLVIEGERQVDAAMLAVHVLGLQREVTAVPSLARLLENKAFAQPARFALWRIGTDDALVALLRLTPREELVETASMAASDDANVLEALSRAVTAPRYTPEQRQTLTAALERVKALTRPMGAPPTTTPTR